jgi:opacity protein-like surface antigen
MVGGGLEYFLADNLALALEGKYVLSGGQRVQIEGARHRVDVDTGLLTLGLRLMYPELRPRSPRVPEAPWRPRFYVGARIGGAIPTQDTAFPGIRSRPEPPAWGGVLDQLFGLAVGVSVGRHLAVELPFEGFETRLEARGRGSLGEYATYSMVPVLRVRSRPLGGALELYGLAGAGVTYAEFNDGKPAGAGLEVSGRDRAQAGAVGVGLEYLVTSNIALGVEAKYLISRGHVLRIGGARLGEGDLDAVLLSVGFRAFLGAGDR